MELHLTPTPSLYSPPPYLVFWSFICPLIWKNVLKMI